MSELENECELLENQSDAHQFLAVNIFTALLYKYLKKLKNMERVVATRE